MAEHLSDEEQLEALKRWWKESGQQTVVFLLIAVLGYFGWNSWQNHEQQQAEMASDQYQQMMEAAQVTPGTPLADEQHAQITYLAVSLQDEHAGSQYAHYASLMLAKLAVEKNDLETAAKELQAVMANADEGLSLIARLRLAKVEAAREKFDGALALLDAVDNKAMAAVYAESRGDIYLLQGKPALAYTAYQTALGSLAGDDQRSRAILELKANQVQPRAVISAETEGDS